MFFFSCFGLWEEATVQKRSGCTEKRNSSHLKAKTRGFFFSITGKKLHVQGFDVFGKLAAELRLTTHIYKSPPLLWFTDEELLSLNILTESHQEREKPESVLKTFEESD